MIDIRSEMGPGRRAPDVTRDYTHLKQLRGPVVFLVLFSCQVFNAPNFRDDCPTLFEKSRFYVLHAPIYVPVNR